MAISPYVIKFELDPQDEGKFLDNPKPLQPVPRAACGGGPGGGVSGFEPATSGAKEPALPELPPAVKAAVSKHLLEVLEILQNGRFEFAFRTAKELVAYLKVSCELAADKAAWEAGKWNSDLEDENLQKNPAAPARKPHKGRPLARRAGMVSALG